MPTDFADVLYLFGRLLLGGLFVVGGVEHFVTLPQLTGFMTQRGVPMPRETLIFGSIWQIVFGVLVIAGVWLAVSGLALALFTALATFMFMNFWDKTGPEKANLRNSFLCNVAIIGALLMVSAQAL